MTNLLLSANHHFLDATRIASGTATGCDVNSIGGGDFKHYWEPSSSGTSHNIKSRVDVGEAGINFFAIKNADLLIKNGNTLTLTVATSEDDSTYTNFYSDTVALTDLAGPGGRDFIYYNSTPAPANNIYTKITLGYASAALPRLTKFYCGAALDLGRNPVSISTKIERSGVFNRSGRRYYDLEYKDIAYDDAMLVNESMGMLRGTQPILMFTTTNHGVLNNVGCVWCELLSLDLPQEVTNRNNISFSLRELL